MVGAPGFSGPRRKGPLEFVDRGELSLSFGTGAEAAGEPCGNAESKRLELSPRRDEAQGLGNLGARKARSGLENLAGFMSKRE